MITPEVFVPQPGPIKALRLPFSPHNPDEHSSGSRDARWMEYVDEVYAIADWCGGEGYDGVDSRDRCYIYIEVLTAGGYTTVSDGSWVFKDSNGDFHTMTHKEFLSSYTRLES